MAIYSEDFGPVILTGEDAEKFKQQIENTPPNPLAKASIERGKKLVEEYKLNGFCRLSLNGRMILL